MARSDRRDPDSVVSRVGLIILALTSVLYLVALDRYPVVFGSDGAHFAIHAESIARTGRDLHGTFLPLFVNITDPVVPNSSSTIWYQPVLFYLMVPFIAVFGVGEWPARFPVALMAVSNIWLVYAIARRLFGTRRDAVAAALILALTPAHIIVGRQALDYIAPLPFVLGWFLSLLVYLDGGRVRTIAVGSFVLGAGLFSYIAAWLLMPCYFLLAAIAIWRSRLPSARRALAASIVAFAIPLAVLATALLSHPQMLTNTLTRYSLSTAAAAPRPDLTERITLYWSYFNPSFLFFAGGSNPTQSTGAVGVFLLALLPLLVAGIREVYRRRDDRWTIVALAIVLAPLPIAITMPPAAAYSIARVMTVLPFAALMATLGLRSLLHGVWPRAAAVLLLLLLAGQFAAFVNDYRGDYQRRAGPRLDPMNARAVADALIDATAAVTPPAIYLSHRLDDGGARWRFYMVQRERLDLLSRTRQINLFDSMPAVEAGALIVCEATEPKAPALIADGYRVVANIAGVTGEPATIVLKAPG